MMTFAQWLEREGIEDHLQPMQITAAFEVMVSRLDAARAAGAADPLRAISTRDAGPNSRTATRRMLERLGYSPVQRRSVHRLLAGSPSGWPGLARALRKRRRPHRGSATVRRQTGALLPTRGPTSWSS